MSRTSPVIAAVALVLATTACGSGEPTTRQDPGEGADGAFDGTVDGTDADEPTDDADGTGDLDGDLDAATEAAIADLAAQEGAEPDAIEVVTAEEVTWPDGALGCPQPGEMYTQALVPGYRVVLELDGREVHYHGGAGDTPTRCDDPQPPAEDGGELS